MAALIFAAAVTAGLAVTAPAWSAEIQACGLGADQPNIYNDGTGSRSGCSGTVTLTVVVNKDVAFWPDPEAGRAQQSNFGNGSLTANGGCQHGTGSYYTETRSSTGNKIQSGRVGRC